MWSAGYEPTPLRTICNTKTDNGLAGPGPAEPDVSCTNERLSCSVYHRVSCHSESQVLFSKNAVATILADVDLEEINRAFVQHWLSLWQGDELPTRTQLNPAKMKRFLTKMMILDVVPDQGVTIRLAGTGLTAVLEMELAGKDWIALAPEHYRQERLRIFSDIAPGAFGVGHRRIDLMHDETMTCEEVILPLARTAAGSIPVIIYVNTQLPHLTAIKSATHALGDPIDFKVIGFGARRSLEV